jgi:hypothetical protein
MGATHDAARDRDARLASDHADDDDDDARRRDDDDARDGDDATRESDAKGMGDDVIIGGRDDSSVRRARVRRRARERGR